MCQEAPLHGRKRGSRLECSHFNGAGLVSVRATSHYPKEVFPRGKKLRDVIKVTANQLVVVYN